MSATTGTVGTTACANGCGARVRGIDDARNCDDCIAKGLPPRKAYPYEKPWAGLVNAGMIDAAKKSGGKP